MAREPYTARLSLKETQISARHYCICVCTRCVYVHIDGGV